jgi:glycosyltransferase involved in cell wall biosynthesis
VTDARTLRTLQVVESCSAGVGRHVIDLSVGLLERGHSVVLAYSESRLDNRFIKGIDQVRHLGGEALALDMRRDVGRHDLLALRAVRQVARRKGPFDVMHGHSAKGGLLVRLAGTRVPKIYTPHAYITMAPDLGDRKKRLYGRIERILGRRGVTINVSEGERRHAVELGIRAEQLHVVYNGIEGVPAIDRVALREEFGIGPDDPVFGWVGRFGPQKNPLAIVEAFGRVAKQMTNARLAMVGDGPLRADVEACIERLGLGDRILLLGVRDGFATMPMFDVFTMSSEYEGFPYVLVEAAAAGLPIVSTMVGGAEEIVTPGQEGLLVPVGDIDGLGKALLEVGVKTELRAEMAEAVRRRAARFAIDTMLEETIAVYLRALSRS